MRAFDAARSAFAARAENFFRARAMIKIIFALLKFLRRAPNVPQQAQGVRRRRNPVRESLRSPG